MQDRIKILYIVGRGRSGSTLLDSILGQLEGFFSVGELRSICKIGLIENRQCGCGLEFRECGLWTGVLRSAFGSASGPDIHQHATELLGRYPRYQHIPFFVLPWREWLARDLFSDYLETLRKLYWAICQQTGSRVIVDSSKSPLYGYLLSLVPSFDVYYIHLIRDSRAVANSWALKQRQPTGFKVKYMRQENPIRSALMWNLWNIMAEMYWSDMPERYVIIRYEDLVNEPRGELRKILNLAGEDNAELPLAAEKTLQLRPNHMVSGNPSRFRTGTVALRGNYSWKTSFGKRNAILVTLLSWPLLHRYGYLRSQ